VAALFRAEQVARAADFEVAHGDFESAAERGVLPDGVMRLPHIGEQADMARGKQE